MNTDDRNDNDRREDYGYIDPVSHGIIHGLPVVLWAIVFYIVFKILGA